MDCPSRPNPQALRAELLLKGYTVARFAAKYRYSVSTLKAAMRGDRRGPKSQEILRRIGRITGKP